MCLINATPISWQTAEMLAHSMPQPHMQTRCRGRYRLHVGHLSRHQENKLWKHWLEKSAMIWIGNVSVHSLTLPHLLSAASYPPQQKYASSSSRKSARKLSAIKSEEDARRQRVPSAGESTKALCRWHVNHAKEKESTLALSVIVV